MPNGIDEPADGFWWARFDGELQVVRILTTPKGVRTVSYFGTELDDLLEVFDGKLIHRIEEPNQGVVDG